jgi:FSR family fosmidomycin resistance protein-like MFS transporter
MLTFGGLVATDGATLTQFRADRTGDRPEALATKRGDMGAERLPRFSVIRNRSLLTLMLGHFTVDTYAGLLPVLYPLLVHRFSLDLATVGLVSLAYSGASSVVQPLFGWLADRKGSRPIGLALIWTAATFATIGFAPTFPILLLLAATAGVGSGMYHPFGAVSASLAIHDPRLRNTAMSVYVTGGTLGVALGPLLGIALFSALGVRGTALMVLPGAAISVWLLHELRSTRMDRVSAAAAPTVERARIAILPMLAIIGVMMSRQWTTASLQAFIPTWYASLGYSPSFYGPLATCLVLASAVGAIGAGSIADRFGRRQVIIVSLCISVPALLLFAQFQGPVAFVTVTLVGLSAASTGPLMLVMAQQLMVGRAGVASGLILGLGFITGAIGIPITGALADAFGMETAIRAQAFLVVATIAIAWLLPTEARLSHSRAAAVQPSQ